ncbi:MAG TPA: hypothetical protein VFP34_05390, partial [Microlunatus sp.]|nr:hypothetical protein [Microlunatus sp.]
MDRNDTLCRAHIENGTGRQALRPLSKLTRSQRKQFPEWVDYQPNGIWIYDTTHFPRAGMAALLIKDLVSRKWLATIVSVEETSPRSRSASPPPRRPSLFARVEQRHADGLVDLSTDDVSRPILLAVSDSGPQMTSGSTREFLALYAIAQRYGRRGRTGRRPPGLTGARHRSAATLDSDSSSSRPGSSSSWFQTESSSREDHALAVAEVAGRSLELSAR